MIAAIGAPVWSLVLALQGTLSNFASGILILVYRPFDVGDVIDAGGVFGTVANMTLVSTKLKSFDNKIMMVPNNDVWNGVITNLSITGTRRVDMVFGIAYNADIATATQIIEEVLTKHDKTLSDPAPVIKVHELADNSVNIIARPWSKRRITGMYSGTAPVKSNCASTKRGSASPSRNGTSTSPRPFAWFWKRTGSSTLETYPEPPLAGDCEGRPVKGHPPFDERNRFYG
jgi:hypothetical protein